MGREGKYEIPQTPEELEKAKKEAGVFPSREKMIKTLLEEEKSKPPEEQDKLLIEKLERMLEHPEEEEKKKKMLLVAEEKYYGTFKYETVEYIYDEEGNPQGVIGKDWEGNIIHRVESTIMKKGDGGKEKELSWIDSDNKVRMKAKLIYDKNGRLIEKTLRVLEEYVGESLIHTGYTSKFEYNDKGELLKEITIAERKDGKTEKKEKDYKYDTKGNLIELVEKDDGIKKREEYRYDEKTGKLIETLLFYENKFIGNYVYEYDEKGNLIAKKYKSKSGKVTPVEEYKYEYDSQGNLIKEIKTQKKIIREIYRAF
jgi:hypothetical protein